MKRLNLWFWLPFLLVAPEGVTGVATLSARVYFQTITREYVDFLRNENTTNSAGDALQANGRIYMVDSTIDGSGDTILGRGVYYLALASDTSGVAQKVSAAVPAAGIPQSLGLLQMAAAFVLPATATFAIYASAFIPWVIAQGYRTVGP